MKRPLVLMGALVIVSIPLTARSAHLTYATDCTDCHSVANAEAEAGTSYISSAARTLPDMKTEWSILGQPNGLAVPDTFGCTFCHYLDVTATKRGVFNHFSGGGSWHPVGFDFSTAGDAGTGDTNGEFLTGWAPRWLVSSHGRRVCGSIS